MNDIPFGTWVIGERLRRLARVTAVGLVLASVAGCSMQPGPVPAPPDHGYGGMVIEAGDTFTDAFETFFVKTDQPITITKVELIDTPPQMQLVDVVVAGEKRESNFQFEPVYPPVEHNTGALVPAVGATLLPLEQQGEGLMGYTLVMAIKITEPGKWVRGGYHLEYELDGVTYGWDATAEITICTPEFVDDDGECLMEDETE